MTEQQQAVLAALEAEGENGLISPELAPLARTFGVQHGAREWGNPILKRLKDKGLVTKTNERREAAAVWRKADT